MSSPMLPRPLRRWIKPFSTSAVVAILLVTVSCGAPEGARPRDAGSAGPSTPISVSATSSPTSSAEPPSPSATEGWTATGPSFGVDRASWPKTVDDSADVLERMPATLEGQTKNTSVTAGEDGTGPAAMAEYGTELSAGIFEEYSTEDTVDGQPELMTARDLLAANFMLGLACDDDTYRGNALPLARGGYPKVAAKTPIWFSCVVDGAEGDDDFTAHAVGWISGKTAWLVLAPDRRTAQLLVTTLHDAAA